MKTLKKITNFVSGNMAVIVIVVAAIALFSPQTVSFLKTSYVNPLLGVVMFGMGLTLKPQDFKVVFSRPKDVIIGCIVYGDAPSGLRTDKGVRAFHGAGHWRHLGGNLPRRHIL